MAASSDKGASRPNIFTWFRGELAGIEIEIFWVVFTSLFAAFPNYSFTLDTIMIGFSIGGRLGYLSWVEQGFLMMGFGNGVRVSQVGQV